MHYGRLTYKDKSLPRMGIDGKVVEAYCDYSVREIINRLAKLEDKIEDGILIELPVKPGTTVYYIQWDYTDDDFTTNHIYWIEEMPFEVWMLQSWGDYIFATEEEAAQRLEEMKNER